MRSIAKPFSLSVLSGVLIGLSFPKANLSFLAWIAMVPLLAALENRNAKESFLYSLLAGWTAFCLLLYWIVPTFQAAGVPVLLGIPCVALLAGYAAVYYGLFGLGVFMTSRTLSPALRLPVLSALWVATEVARIHVYTGFPWGFLGYSQWRHPALVQTAQWTGVYGTSFLIAAANLFIHLRGTRKGIPAFAAAWFLAPMLFSLWVYRSESGPRKEGPSLNISVLQGNIDQYKKWDAAYEQDILSVYRTLSRSSAASVPGPDIILWPETAVPGWIPNDARLLDWVREETRNTTAYHLIGAVTRERGTNYNSAFLFTPSGNIESRYDKIHLVPFGEFVPLQSLLGRWIPVLNELGGFEPGERIKVLPLPGAPAGVTICYESIFPDVYAEQCVQGASWLANLTNDGWYLDTAAPEQHFSMNVFRAVENRRTLVRATNTGISGVILPSGRIAARTGLNERTVMNLSVHPEERLTFYSRYGDIFAWLCVAAALTAALYALKDLNAPAV